MLYLMWPSDVTTANISDVLVLAPFARSKHNIVKFFVKCAVLASLVRPLSGFCWTDLTTFQAKWKNFNTQKFTLNSVFFFL